MKILFLESSDWEGSVFRQAIADLTQIERFDIQAVPSEPLHPAALAAYDIVFLPLQAGEDRWPAALPTLNGATPYWVLLTDGQDLQGLNSWLPQSAWDYITQAHLAPPHLALALQKILNTVQREKRLQALEQENHLLKTALDQVPSRTFVNGGAGHYGLTTPEPNQAAEPMAFQASLLHQVSNGIITTDLDGNILHWNRYAEVMYQWTAAETIGKNIMAVLVPREGQLQAHAILQSVEEKGYWEGEFEVYRKDGSLLPIYIVNSLIRNEQDAAVGFIGVSIDISDRRRLEADRNRQASLLAGQQKILELIALGNPLPEVLDQLITFLEAQTPGMVGSVLLRQGQQLWHGAAPSLPDQYQQAINGMPIGPQEGSCGTAAYRNETTIVADIATDPLWTNYRHLALPHGLKACWSVPIVSRTGQVLGTFAQYYREPRTPSAHDWDLINTAVKLAGLAIEQQQSDEALRASEARFRAIFEQAAVGICQISLEGRFLQANQQFCQFLGYTLDELLTHTFQEVTYPDDLGISLQVYRHLLKQKHSTFTLEKRYIRKDRTVVWGSVSVTLMLDDTQSSPALLPPSKILRPANRPKQLCKTWSKEPPPSPDKTSSRPWRPIWPQPYRCAT